MERRDNICEVQLELLRHGEPHNQPLSRNTPYLALCGNAEPAPLNLPFDQLEFERRLDELSYASPGNTALLQLDEMADRMRSFLSAVPGLGFEIGSAIRSQVDMVHLRLVLTPHELALLPYECTQVPRGVPGGTTTLALHSEFPTTITREVRGVGRNNIVWPGRPKILFAWAAPPGVGDVPWEDHAFRLRCAIDPWINPKDAAAGKQGISSDDTDPTRQVRAMMHILPQATLEDIRAACIAESYTHVHILAHGVPYTLVRDIREYGVALLGTDGTLDVVSGKRLAGALNVRHADDGASPAVVTLATCESGQIRSVLSVGGSIAHVLHVQGVPFVVASQFPLSKFGSTLLVDELYKRLFDAEDPRVALFEARRRLHVHSAKYHDWASIVAYAALPRDMAQQIKARKFEARKRDINRILRDLDRQVDRLSTAEDGGDTAAKRAPPETATAKEVVDSCDALLARLRGPVAELNQLHGDKAESIALQASAAKREAEVLYWLARKLGRGQDGAAAGTASLQVESRRRMERSLDKLRESLRLYDEALLADTRHGVGVQLLSLQFIVRRAETIDEPPSHDLWVAMKVVAERSLGAAKEAGKPSDRLWAHGSLAELHLIAALWIAQSRTAAQAGGPGDSPGALPDLRDPVWGRLPDALAAMDREIAELKRLASTASFEWFSTRRQFRRYAVWWRNYLGPAARKVAEQAYQHFR